MMKLKKVKPMNVLKAAISLISIVWWKYVIFCGGKRHDSYVYAVWSLYNSKMQLKEYLNGQ